MRLALPWGVVAVLVLASVVARVARAGDLLPPLTLENAQVLPPKVGNPRYIQFFFNADLRFSGGGQREPLGAKLSQPIFWQDVIDAQAGNALKTQQVQAVMLSAGFAADDVAGYSSGEVKTYVNTKVPTLAFGVTENWTIAAIVPLITVQANADTGFRDTSDKSAQKFISTACVSNAPECSRAATKLNNPVNEKLARLGYETIPNSQTISGMGDVQLISKYSFHRNDLRALSLKNTVVLPTGRAPNVDRALDITTGDGRYQLGVGLVGDHRLPFSRDTRVTGFANTNLLMPVTLERRLPAASDDVLSADKETLRKDLGASLTSGVGLLQEFPKLGLQLGGQYQAAYTTAVTYSGGARFAAERYDWLNQVQPSQTLHSVAITAGFSSVRWYQDKQFVYPFQANLVYAMPLAGRNIPLARVIAGELVLFF